MPRSQKKPIWLPYTSSIEVKGQKLDFIYKGGRLTTEIKNLHSIMFYGAVCPLQQNFLELCSKYKVPICIHRRNMEQAVWITPSVGPHFNEDLLSRQIQFRNSIKKSTHICKKILEAKFKAMEWLVKSPTNWMRRNYSQKEMINIEAIHAAKYWKIYFRELGYENESRRSKNSLSTALDAASKFYSSIFLRWILYHKLSPHHGFIHLPCTYPSLVYDLVEPYRGYIEKVIFEKIKTLPEKPKDLTGIVISTIEDFMDQQIYTDSTRQIVTFQELFHGSVLALRSYLIGQSKGLILPKPAKPNGGRPIKAGYKLYGRSAGPTDFWEVASDVSTKYFDC
ncbi:MAG: CRISPR-associated endonuclease Cas1 [Candidatus Caenarcaniphilales bacterium]|jgi:CRISPR/Cas system-associated endonuclease Cas1|nr:CRISPR-associated endonuclease Cas1 [Candidatus Caenarcaniphilales bacterium]